MFQINDYVYYASGGVCLVSDICQAPLAGMPADRCYYVLRSLHNSNSVMYIPVDSETVFIRSLMSREEAEALLAGLEEIQPFEEPNAKLLKARYAEAMKTHTPAAWVRVIKTVWKRLRRLAEASRTQRLSDTERSYGEDALRYLSAELSIALDRSVNEVERLVRPLLEKE